MYAYLRGQLITAEPPLLILDVQGVGYQVLAPHSVFGALPPLGEEIQLFTSFQVKETSHTLYGFLTSNERDAFESLCSVSGIGPKLALSLLSHLNLDQLLDALHQDDTAALSRVPGIGKKTAGRLIVDLRDRFASLMYRMPTPQAVSTQSHLLQDAVRALINLGYTQSRAREAVDQALADHPTDNLPQLITDALRCCQPA